MMKLFNSIGLVLLISATSGCAMLPYENEYSCRLKDNYGKCIAVESAYKEAVTGQSQGKPMVPHSEQFFYPDRDNESHASVIADGASSNAYEDYRERTYRILASRIQDTHDPLLAPAATIRTLVLAYSPDEGRSTLYMPRFVYSILDPSRWLLAQEEHKKQELMTNFIKTKEASRS